MMKQEMASEMIKSRSHAAKSEERERFTTGLPASAEWGAGAGLEGSNSPEFTGSDIIAILYFHACSRRCLPVPQWSHPAISGYNEKACSVII